MPTDNWYADWYKKSGLIQPENNPQSQWQDYTQSGVSGMLESAGFKNPDKYAPFIGEYNPYKEVMAQQNYSETMSGLKNQKGLLSNKYNEQLYGLLGKTESATAKSGFAGSGAINRATDRERSTIGFDYMSGVKGMNLEKKSAATSLWGAIEGSRQDYMEQFYNQMANLIQGGAKLYKEGDTKTDENGWTWTYSNGEWVLTSKPHGDGEDQFGMPKNPEAPSTLPSAFGLGGGNHKEGDTTEYGGETWTWRNGVWVDSNGNPYDPNGGYPNPFN